MKTTKYLQINKNAQDTKCPDCRCCWAVYVVGHRQRLTLGRSRSSRKLRSLKSVIQSEYTHIHKRRKNAVDAVVEQVIQLTLGQHREFRDGDFEFIHLERHVIAMKIAAVIDIARGGIDNRVVASRIKLADKHLLHITERIVHGSQNLRHATQRIVRLHLVLKDLLVRMGAVVEFRLAVTQAVTVL